MNSAKSLESMKIQFRIRGLNGSADVRDWLAQALKRLQDLIPITDAAVVVERQRDQAPPFRVFVSLAVPGPDIHAEAREHTLQAVWLKVTTALRRQIKHRKTQQELRKNTVHQGRNGSARKRSFSPVLS